MNSYTEHLNKRVMDQAFDIGVLRGTLKGILKYNSNRLPGHVVEDMERVLRQTEDKPIEEVPTFHNGATIVEIESERYTGEVM